MTTAQRFAQPFELFRIPRSLDRDPRSGAVDVAEVVRRELEVDRPDVLFEATPFGRARDRDDPRLPGQQPREGHLTGCRLPAPRDRLQKVHQRLIRLPVLRGEARHAVSEIGAVERRRLVDPPREEPLPQGTERHQADAELLQRWQQLPFGLAVPQGVLALNGGDRLHGMCAADGAGGRFGEAEVPDLALRDQVLHRARDILDRDVGVDPVLVVEVDGVDPQALQ
jgi:hypothetical protein